MSASPAGAIPLWFQIPIGSTEDALYVARKRAEDTVHAHLADRDPTTLPQVASAIQGFAQTIVETLPAGIEQDYALLYLRLALMAACTAKGKYDTDSAASDPLSRIQYRDLFREYLLMAYWISAAPRVAPAKRTLWAKILALFDQSS